ncbi:GNAT family N-acetyltransferase [Curtobacterium flaccumfaciens pv. flaccumfaciens]|uniref:GNAT family N-acetyltransferase n=1 Tax=Curtobacterium aurantiacum TaxID=3236919 RepID=A0ABS5VFA7_9MICO|nr:GNAT family N-acetyltransferase [Curtobacterium flaccumfaciens pv. flaccumfaciens]MBT1588179.1 GNAT family N-acetyltransferase [Curtobacterium flaccumfaciens pv. flaccumfaciens]MBT1679756.1 GNAT family N-acetyltransferase [Curtobacterium flaccumfaciens pv. flaccumfaciens]
MHIALHHAATGGAKITVVDTDIENVASQRVLETNGLIEES